jgi:hypothetical protein
MQKAKVKIEEKMGGLPDVAALRQVDGGVLRFSEKRRQAAAVQDAGAIHSAPVGSTQAVDIPSKMTKSRVVSTLISRQLQRKPRVSGAFLALNHLDFPAVTKIPPDFYGRTIDNPANFIGGLGARRGWASKFNFLSRLFCGEMSLA